MSKLITAGCSFTQYCWPTWADYMGMHYAEHVQRGLCGIDCASISRLVLSTDISSDDHVVIAWTGFDRHSLYSENEWQDIGSIVSNKDYFINHYHSYERFYTMLDYMKLVDLDSKYRGYKLWNFSAYPWLLGETEKNPFSKSITKAKNLDIKNLFMDFDLESFRNKSGTIITQHKYNDSDNHPTPECHWNWLAEFIAEKCNLELNLDIAERVSYDQRRVLNGDVD